MRRRKAAGHFILGLLLGFFLACDASLPQGPQIPQRIVTLAPNLTEIVFSLGLEDRVVGVGDFSRWPPEVAQKPRLGGLLDPNLEGIVALKPDLGIVLPSQSGVAERLRRLGIEVLIVPADSIADIEQAIPAIAERCGVLQTGMGLLQEWKTRLEPRPLSAPVRVMLSVARQPGVLAEVLVAGPDTFLGELLTRLGAENVFADVDLAYPQVGLEEVLARAPEVIVELRSEQEEAATVGQLREDWERLPQIPAAQSGRIPVIGGDHVLIPGPRLPQLYDQLEAALEGNIER